jgi:hypothetical protein
MFAKSKWIVATLCSLFCLTGKAGAVIVTEPWTVNIVGGPYNGVVGTGSFSYDNAQLVFGDETLSPTTSLTLSLTIFGQTFTEVDDIDFTSFPRVDFSAFVPVNMDYIVSETDLDNPTPINQGGVRSFSAQGPLVPLPGGGYQQDGTAIPEPAAATILIPAVLYFALRRRRPPIYC